MTAVGLTGGLACEIRRVHVLQDVYFCPYMNWVRLPSHPCSTASKPGERPVSLKKCLQQRIAALQQAAARSSTDKDQDIGSQSRQAAAAEASSGPSVANQVSNCCMLLLLKHAWHDILMPAYLSVALLCGFAAAPSAV